MTDENVGRHWSRNRLLAAIPAIDRALLEPHAQFVELAQGQVLFEPEEDVVITHFPLTGTMAALIVVLEDGRTAEAASIGREGAIGGIISAGHKPAFTRAVIQIAGPAFRVETARIEVAKQRSSVVRDLFDRYADVLLAQVLQSVVCNAFHPMRQRLARWLLMTQRPHCQQRASAHARISRSDVGGTPVDGDPGCSIAPKRRRNPWGARSSHSSQPGQARESYLRMLWRGCRHYERILQLAEAQRVKNAKEAAKHKRKN